MSIEARAICFILGLVGVVIIGVIAIYQTLCRYEEQDKMTRHIERLEDNLKEQLNYSQRTLDTSSRIMIEALRLSNQQRGYGGINGVDYDETED